MGGRGCYGCGQGSAATVFSFQSEHTNVRGRLGGATKNKTRIVEQTAVRRGVGGLVEGARLRTGQRRNRLLEPSGPLGPSMFEVIYVQARNQSEELAHT